MDINKDKLLEMLDDIRKVIVENEKPDGSLGIDATRAMVVLDFAKTEIEKTISV